MAGLLNRRLLLRFLALGVLTLCVTILSRSNVDTPLARTKPASPPQAQGKMPTVTTQLQPQAPLAISALRTVSWDGQSLEVAMELVNVSSKSIRAYAVKQALEGDASSGQVMFVSLEANNKTALQPNQLTTTFDVYQASSTKEEQHVVFGVDYVEFSDGTKWGLDSGKSAERSEGQRAAGSILTKRLLQIEAAGSPAAVMNAIEKGEANIEPPAHRSEEWKEGFRLGCKSIEQHLKRAQMRGGLSQLDRDLRQLGQRFKGVE